MRPLRLRPSATTFTTSCGPCFTKPSHRRNGGRSVVTATRPPRTSQESLSPGSRSSASRTSFGTVVCPLLVIVDLGMSLIPYQRIPRVRRSLFLPEARREDGHPLTPRSYLGHSDL